MIIVFWFQNGKPLLRRGFFIKKIVPHRNAGRKIKASNYSGYYKYKTKNPHRNAGRNC